MRNKYYTALFLIWRLLFAEAVTVNPALCPTNKIAPHRRAASWDRSRPRTFGAFYELLTPGDSQNDPSSLQEKPQEDDPDDCREIEDYDENDLSSITPNINRRQQNDNRFFFGGLFNGQSGSSSNSPNVQRPPSRPTTTRPPYPATRPPYASGGHFSNNHYRPPAIQYPSDHIKPVHEGAFETQATYRPDVVGGPLGHVVGVSPVRPTRNPFIDFTTQAPLFPNRYRPGPTQPTGYRSTRRPRRLNSNSGIIESFVDLLFK